MAGKDIIIKDHIQGNIVMEKRRCKLFVMQNILLGRKLFQAI